MILRCVSALAAVSLIVPAEAIAQVIEPVTAVPEELTEGEVLLPQNVLRSSAARFPDILASFERVAAARGDQVEADGAFDLLLQADGSSQLTGFYSGTGIATRATQPLRSMGAEVYGGYTLSDGTFSSSDSSLFTNRLGEVKFGALFSLLRDRTIDERRFELEDTRLATTQASLDVLLTQLGVQFQALQAYWRWVAAGRELEVFRNLLEIAEAREIGLRRQVAMGARPEIALVENRQNILRRQTLVAEAAQRFANAANALSFYYRGPGGALITPEPDMLPSREELDMLPDIDALMNMELNTILRNRPELRQLQVAIDRTRNRINLRENNLRPRLDLNVEVARGIGPVGDGGPVYDGTETAVGFTFSVPFQRRQALGQLQRAEAELRELRLREQRAADQIAVELERILVDLDAALDIARLARSEVEQAELMVTAERRRNALGASDFFLINLREETAADAQVRALRAELTGRLAEASYDAATMNLEKLGLYDGGR